MQASKAMRLAALTLAAVVALSACSAGSSEAEPEDQLSGAGRTLHAFVPLIAANPEEQQDWITEISATFKTLTGADLKVETFASASDELTKIQTSAVAGQGPDVFSLGSTFVPTAYATGAFVTLTPDDWAKVGGVDRFTESSLGLSGPDEGNRIGIPFGGAGFMMAYNKELLDAAGIANPATTWDELTEQAVQLTDPANGIYGLSIGYKDNFDPWKFIWGMSVQAGNPIVDEGQAAINDDAVTTAYETYFGWLTTAHVVDPASVGWANSQALANFAEGKAAYFPMTTSLSASTFESSAIAGKWEYALLPTTAPGENAPKSGSPAASILACDYYVVAEYSKNKDLAFAFINLITNEEQAVSFAKRMGSIPSNAAALEELAAAPHMAASTEAVRQSQATPFTGAWSEIQLALTNVVVQTIPDLSAGTVPEDALAQRIQEAQATAQSALDRVR